MTRHTWHWGAGKWFMSRETSLSFPKCVFSLDYHGKSDDHAPCKCFWNCVDQTTRWLLRKQSKNKACRGTTKSITTPSELARCFKTSTGLFQSLDTARISLPGLPVIRGLQIPYLFLKRMVGNISIHSLCRAEQYTSLKVCVSQDTESSPILNEINMLRRLKRFADTDQRDHPGIGFTRFAEDIFEIDQAFLHGRHYCIALKP